MSRVLSPLSYRATTKTVPVRQASSVSPPGMIVAMHLVIASGILGLGKSVSSFGQTLALVLTFFVVLGGLVNVLIGYIVGQVMVERKENADRRQAYDAAHTR
jgi:membrane protein YqaA with SNARE-associated domain